MAVRDNLPPLDRDQNAARLAGQPAAERPRDPQQSKSESPQGEERVTLGRYHILRRLGQGGMGAVYLAEDTHLKRPVALKIPEFRGDADGDLLSRFYREARAAATIHHSHLCPVYDVGEIDGTHYLTMAYIEGEPLSSRTRQPEKRFSVFDAATLVRKLALAIHEAHLKGVIHRDLKPSNVMLTRQGEPVIVDFGLARRADCDDVTLTRLGTLMGTPAYMSPEQVEGDLEQIGPKSDQYSLGVVLYELLTGRLPFQGSVASVLGQIARDTPPPPSDFRNGLDARIESICLKMMARKPAERYGSGLEAAAALEGWLKAAAGGSDALPEPLRAVARTIAPPASGDETYALSQPPVVTHRTGAAPAPPAGGEFRERIVAWLVEGHVREALLALEAAPTAEMPREACLKEFIAALQQAVDDQLRSRNVKRAVRVASALNATGLSPEFSETLARALAAQAKSLWNESDPGPAVQVWQAAIERFAESPLLKTRAAIFAANRALECEKKANLGLAAAMYRQSLAFDPEPVAVRRRFAAAYCRLAERESAQGRFDQAIKVCDQGLRVLPGSRSLRSARQQILDRKDRAGL